MPTSLFSEMDHGGATLENERALQLALELSMFGLNTDSDDINSSSFDSDGRPKKSQNMTECVPVPSSEHVAEIVGRQGCKIKALRAKTNTYIKTPVRGEEPVFVVTGRKEDVALAKREILSAADHFSQIRASRKSNMNGSLAPGPPNNIPGQVTIQVRVPYRVVGLVVGPKGATIKRIQQETQTYIVTPSREKDPVFEVTGLPDNVETAKKEIESHIAMRTGGVIGPCDDQNDFHTNGIDQNLSNDIASLYKTSLSGLNSLNSAFSTYNENNSSCLLGSRNTDTNNIFSFPSMTNGSAKISDFGISSFSSNGFNFYDSVDEGISESPTFDPAVAPPTPSSLWPDFSSNRNSIMSFSSSTTSGILSGLSRRSSSISGPSLTPRLSPTLTDNPLGLLDSTPSQRISSDPLGGISLLPSSTSDGFMSGVMNSTSVLLNGFGTSLNNEIRSSAGSTSSSPTDSIGSAGRKGKRDCIICYESDIVSALVPCGHNMFCMECANRLCDKPKPECPVCHQLVHQAIRIYT